MGNPFTEGPIGVFDSGVGGLSVLRALWQALPHESFYYIADGAHCPYSAHTLSEIEAFSLGIADYLKAQGAKVIVVACNTASASALPALRARMGETPVVGMVPALKTAVGLTQRRTVGVLATEITLQGYLYRQVQERFANGVQVIARPCPGLVERIEAGDIDSPATESLLRECLAPIMAAQADVVVLGCTHYPFVLPLMRQILGPDVLLLEPSEAVARQVGRVLEMQGLLAKGNGPAKTYFATTGRPDALQTAIARLLGVHEDVSQLVWKGERLENFEV